MGSSSKSASSKRLSSLQLIEETDQPQREESTSHAGAAPQTRSTRSSRGQRKKKPMEDLCHENWALFTECPASCGDSCPNRRIQKNERAKGITKRLTKNKGYGVFTDNDIKKGDYIIEYVGEVVSEAVFEERMHTIYATDNHHYCLYLERGLVIDGHRAGNEGRYVNHSCEPNCEMQKWSVNGLSRMALFALRDIRPGEELSYDYNFCLFNESAGQPCYCGSEHCRGVIGKRTNNGKNGDAKGNGKLKKASTSHAKAAPQTSTLSTRSSNLRPSLTQRSEENPRRKSARITFAIAREGPSVSKQLGNANLAERKSKSRTRSMNVRQSQDKDKEQPQGASATATSSKSASSKRLSSLRRPQTSTISTRSSNLRPSLTSRSEENVGRKTTRNTSKSKAQTLIALSLVFKDGKKSKEAINASKMPQSSFYRHLGNCSKKTYKKYVHSLPPVGRPPLLTDTLEKRFVRELMRKKSHVPRLRRSHIREAAYIFFNKNNVEHNFSITEKLASLKWYRGFVKRHPEVLGARATMITGMSINVQQPQRMTTMTQK